MNARSDIIASVGMTLDMEDLIEDEEYVVTITGAVISSVCRLRRTGYNDAAVKASVAASSKMTPITSARLFWQQRINICYSSPTLADPLAEGAIQVPQMSAHRAVRRLPNVLNLPDGEKR